MEIIMRLHHRWVGAVLVALGMCAASGCDGHEKKEAAPPVSGPVVAVVGDAVITQKEYEAKLAEQPAFVRERYKSMEKKKELLETQVRFKLLAQEAHRRGLESDPEVREMLEKAMVQRLIKAQAEAPGSAEVSDAEAKAFYEANLADYVKPERVRVSQLVLTAPKGSSERKKALARAAQLISEVQASGDTLRAFDAATRAHSQDTASKPAGGDLGFRTREELEARGGAPLAQAAFELKTVGQMSAPIESDQGVHVLFLLGRQLGSNQSYEQAKPRIVQRLSAERHTKAVDALVQSLREKTRVEIKEDVLSKVDPSALKTPETPAPGANPAP
jgi:parvulin-like peptidyl-prolyl isomerase